MWIKAEASWLVRRYGDGHVLLASTPWREPVLKVAWVASNQTNSMRSEILVDIQSLLILHTGGNDALHSLRNPRMLALLISDLYSLRSSNEDKLELSFPRELGKAVTSRLDDFFASAAVHGHRHIVLSTLPIISCLPLARLLVQLLVPGANAGFVTRSLRALGRSINQSVCGDIQSLAAKHGVYAQVFDEASQLELLAEEAGASQLGLSDGLRLVLRQLQRILTGPVKDSGFWHDGHHPAAEAHERLAEEAEKILHASPPPGATLR